MFLIRHSRLNSTTLHDVPAFFVRSLSTQRRSGNSKQVARKYKGNRRGINWELQRKEFKLCILGRPNAGKSTLFNALVRRNAAIVSNIAGTTRDRREGMGSLGELRFRVIDTGGLEELNKGPTSGFDADNTGLLPSMMAQVEFAMDEADVGLFLLDAKQGVTKDDEFFVKWLRKRQVSEGRKLPIHLLANKAESLGHAFEWGNSDLRWEQFMVDCYRLGFGEPIPMSAEHRQGLGDLYSVLEPYGLMSVEEAMNKTEPLNSFVSPKPIRSTPLIGLEQGTTNAVQEIGTSTASLNKVEDKSDGEPFGVVHSVSTTSLENSKTTQRTGEVDMSGPIKLALVGRTNVGKSTLFNHLIGKQRVITGPLAGLTRDAIQVEWQYESTKIHLIDTAGMQKQSKLYLAAKKGATQSQRDSELPGRLEQSTLEGLSIDKSMNALEMAQIVVVVVELDKTEDDKGREKLQLRSHDLTIMSRIMSEGRGMVIVVNKSDTIVPDNYDDTIGASKYIQEQVEEQLTDAVPLARGVPIIPISALHGDNVSSLMPQVLTVYRKWNAKIPTHKLNKFVAEAQENRSAPQKPMNIRSRRIGPNAKPRMAPVKIKFMNQMYTRPPHFALFTNRLHGESALPPSYISYLTNRLRTEFNLQGIPVRFTVKGSKNPYAGKGLRPERKQSDTGLNTVDGDRSPKRNDHLRRRPQVMKPKRGVGRKLQMAGYRKRFKQGHTNH